MRVYVSYFVGEHFRQDCAPAHGVEGVLTVYGDHIQLLAELRHQSTCARWVCQSADKMRQGLRPTGQTIPELPLAEGVGYRLLQLAEEERARHLQEHPIGNTDSMPIGRMQ
jgi:hypothetical protein